MSFTLDLIGEQPQGLGAGSRSPGNAGAGTSGRLPQNDWGFPDPSLSDRHASIGDLNGQYFVEDSATLGVVIAILTKPPWSVCSAGAPRGREQGAARA